MHATVKGALAAGAAGTLLLGGVGTLAYWNATGTIGGGTINSGDLQLDASSCTTAGWTVSNTVENVMNQVFALGTDEIVPGDVLKKTCTIGVTAVGQNLRANLAVTNGTTTGSTLSVGAYSVAGAFTLGGSPVTSITDANTGQAITATITVTFPIGSSVDNTSKTKTIVLGDFTVTATQATT
jgi:alternate signal-mediated exported protein